MKSEKLKNFYLLLVTLFLIILLFEIILRLFKPQIFEIHPKGMYLTNPMVGYLLKPGYQGFIEREEFTQYFRVNDQSCRGRNYKTKDADSYRILILGDSYTFGFGVKEKETFGAYLEKCLSEKTDKKVEVINGGVPGYGTIDQLNFLKLFGDSIKPDIIIIQFLPVNDFDENREPAALRSDVVNGYLTAKSQVSETTSSISFSDVIYWLKSNMHSVKFASERLGYLAMKMGISGGIQSFWGEDFTKDDEKITSKAIHDIVSHAKYLNSEILLLYTVGQGQVISEKRSELSSEKFIRSVAESENIKWINTLSEMRKRKDRDYLYYPIDGHWTSKGHYAVAEMICNNFTNHYLTVFDKP